MTLSNMSAELGAQVGLIAPDETTRRWLSQLEKASGLAAVGAANLANRRKCNDRGHHFDATKLSPMVAAPHSPANGFPVDEFTHEPIQVAYVGACTGAKLEDMQAAASVLRGKVIAPGVELMVAPPACVICLWQGGRDVCNACAGGGSVFTQLLRRLRGLR